MSYQQDIVGVTFLALPVCSCVSRTVNAFDAQFLLQSWCFENCICAQSSLVYVMCVCECVWVCGDWLCCYKTVPVGSVLLQDEAKGDSQTPVVINMDGSDQRLAERQQQLHLIDEQVIIASHGRQFLLISCAVGWISVGQDGTFSRFWYFSRSFHP